MPLGSSFLARLQKFGFYESKGPKELLARVQGGWDFFGGGGRSGSRGLARVLRERVAA